MSYPNIALMGRARSGKDTIAKRLIHQDAYVRVAFADPLKDMALRIDPFINKYGSGPMLRLSDVEEIHGWERAKDDYPEVRRFLQHLGQSIREQDEDYWLRQGLRKLDVAAKWNIPVVVTDVRYPNEYEALRGRGFKMVRITRPEPGQIIDWNSIGGDHESETALSEHEYDVLIRNNGPLAQLYQDADALADH
ncbi:deoxynucleotide monophosphate kinase family protein [Streptomyces nigrescens]|uniref:deoxynucleotide monophosphate kinase family protein n=1 Tax=Streptomyces nigrescens TaxID=1920 RepID=UPI0038102073